MNDNGNHEELWNQAAALKSAQQKLLLDIGTTYTALRRLKDQLATMEADLAKKQEYYDAIDEQFQQAGQVLALEHGINEGTVALDFDKREVTNGQVPGIGDGQS